MVEVAHGDHAFEIHFQFLAPGRDILFFCLCNHISHVLFFISLIVKLEESLQKSKCVTCRRAEELLHDDLYGLDHEEAWILYLSPGNTFIEKEMVSKGTLDKTAIDCRTLLRQALLHNAASIIVLHNHPSGDPMPNTSDIFLTNKLRQACSLIDIKLIDHIIVGEEVFYSFSDEQTHKIIN